MRRALRIALVGTLALVMCFDSATACHFFRGRWGGHCGCGPAYCDGYADYAGPCRGTIISSDGCCDETIGYEGEYVDEYYDGGVVIEGETVPSEATPAPMPPQQESAETFRPMETDEAPSLPQDTMPAERPAPATGEDELFAPPTEEPMPRDTAPAERPVTTPPAEPADELFTPPAETAPAPMTPPAEEETDLFNADEEPVTPAETPAEPPAETPPAEPMDGLFGTEEDAGAPADSPAPPADSTPAEEPSGTELFGEGTEGEATETPAEEAPAGEAPAEDSAAPAEGEAPATEEPADSENLFEDLGKILREPGGLSSSEMRRWVDNTGEYSCNGRLVRFLDGQVRLLKDNGRTTTVPLYRLSQNDLEFVHRQASAQQADVMGQMAQASTLVPMLAN